MIPHNLLRVFGRAIAFREDEAIRGIHFYSFAPTFEYIAILSAVTAAEVEQAPEQVQNIYAELINAGAESLSVSTEAMDLLSKYSDRKILGPRFQNDMLHIAIATIAEADVLVSWNFRHIVRQEFVSQNQALRTDLLKSLAIASESLSGSVDNLVRSTHERLQLLRNLRPELAI
jgi:hypothetical protein